MKYIIATLLIAQSVSGESYELSKSFDINQQAATSEGAPTIATVGSDNQCTYTTIQEAVDNSNEVRIATNGSPYFENINISVDDATVVKGGYANCTDAVNNITDLSKPIIDGGGDTDDVIDIRTVGEVSVSNLIIGNGRRGIWIPSDNNTIARINNVTSFNNDSAGMSVTGNGNKMLISNSNISFNSYAGVHCRNDNEVFIFGNTIIEDNTNSISKGGGIYAYIDCQVSVLSPTIIRNNSATEGGGGVFVASGADVGILSGSFTCIGIPCGSNTQTVTLKKNDGNSDNNSSGNGGAVLVEGAGSSVIAFNALFTDNIAHYGGAVSTDLGGSFIAGSFYNGDEGCWSVGSCSQFEKNKAVLGAVTHAIGQSSITVATSVIKNNRANAGIVAYIFENSEITMNNNMIIDNGNNSEGNYQDRSLFAAHGGNLTLEYQTIADNKIENEVIDNNESNISVRSSIIAENVIVYNEQDNATEQFECLIVNETDSFSAGGTVIVATPLFVNPTQGDYRNQPNSPAVDYCYDINVSGNKDIEDNTHGSDYAGMDNLHGTFDLGADEFIIDNDIIFKNGLEID